MSFSAAPPGLTYIVGSRDALRCATASRQAASTPAAASTSASDIVLTMQFCRRFPLLWLSTSMASANNLLFVYGTLKRGFPNAMHMCSAQFQASATTVEAFPLVVDPQSAIPYLINKPGAGHRIAGEVFAVDEHDWPRLDYFEGVPDHYYQRLAVDVVPRDGGAPLTVNAYFRWDGEGFMSIQDLLELEFIPEYLPHHARPVEPESHLELLTTTTSVPTTTTSSSQ